MCIFYIYIYLYMRMFLQLKKNLYLLHSDPDNTLKILNKFKFLCGMDTKLTLNKHPKIIISSWKTIEQISKHFSVFIVYNCFYKFSTYRVK